jgi:hypothetical protein
VDAPGGAQGQGGGRFGGSFGPEVVPGSYTVRVSVADQSSEQPLAVHPDPRVDIPMADRVAKFEAQMEALELNARSSEMQRVVREVNQAADRVIAAVRGLDGDDARELGRAGRELKTALEEAVDFGAANRQRRALFAMGSSWDAPTEGELLALRRTAAAIDALESVLNEFLAGPVADFRAQTLAAELDLFPAFEPVGGGQ